MTLAKEIKKRYNEDFKKYFPFDEFESILKKNFETKPYVVVKAASSSLFKPDMPVRYDENKNGYIEIGINNLYIEAFCDYIEDLGFTVERQRGLNQYVTNTVIIKIEN